MATPPPIMVPPRRRVVPWLAIVIVLAFLGLVAPVLIHPPRMKKVVRISSADPRLQAASKQAQQELDTFLSALSHPKPGQRFAIAGRFSTPQGPEYLWVKDPTFANGKFTGILDQPPLVYAGAHRGDSVTVDRVDVFDWMIKDGAEIRGRYTDKVLSQGG